ncbi:MAG: alpha/beta hydrolase [Candidatus Bipolaricaulota bacterium]
MQQALRALDGDQEVEVREEKLGGVETFVFWPKNDRRQPALIFYPGARVPAEAYSPHLLEIARQGFTVYLVKMPLNFALLGWGRAGKVISARPEQDCWVLGGHSLGGAMAARFVDRTDFAVYGLVLWASYPEEGLDLDKNRISVLSLIGTRDSIIDEGKVTRAREQLPEKAEFVNIEGGNHSQFGWYGFQQGDGQAAIERDEQVEIIVSETTDFLYDLCS